MSNDMKLPLKWNSIVNLCIQFKNANYERKQIFIEIVKQFIELCNENNVKMTQKKAVKMMKAFLELSNDDKSLLKLKDILYNLTVPTKFNVDKWNIIAELSNEFASRNKKNIFQKIVIEFMQLCHDKKVYITKNGAIRMMKAFLEISNDNDDEIEFADLFYTLMVADDFNDNNNSLNK